MKRLSCAINASVREKVLAHILTRCRIDRASGTAKFPDHTTVPLGMLEQLIEPGVNRLGIAAYWFIPPCSPEVAKRQAKIIFHRFESKGAYVAGLPPSTRLSRLRFFAQP